MSGAMTTQPAPRLIIESRLDDLARVASWAEALAVAHGIPEETLYAIQLCLEEALSNIVRHGYGGEPGHSITVEFVAQGEPGGVRELAFVVEDQAPPFDPLGSDAAVKAPASIDELRPGGQGLRLLRKFAGGIEYRRLADGNRLTLRFAIPG